MDPTQASSRNEEPDGNHNHDRHNMSAIEIDSDAEYAREETGT